MHYYNGDIKTQAKILEGQIESSRVLYQADKKRMIQQAIEKLHKRLARFYGFNNKYDGKGNLRNNVDKERKGV